MELLDPKFLKVIKYYNLDAEDLKCFINSGSSSVYLHPTFKFVLQYYYSNSVCKNILYLFNNLMRSHSTEFNFNECIVFEYDHRLLFPRFETYAPCNTLVWEKHECLCDLSRCDLRVCLEANYMKLLWDIGRALLTLHELGYTHNECCIENIGIRGNNFILFDFGGAKKVGEEGEGDAFHCMDIYRLLRSLCENIFVYDIPPASNVKLFLFNLIINYADEYGVTVPTAIGKLNCLRIN